MQAETSPRGTEKLGFLEGLRGIACIQVVLLHYAAAFLPPLARVGGRPHFRWEATLAKSPVFALLDGYTAVFLFFVMSGFVLAGSFGRSHRPAPILAAKRLLRLFVPVAGAFAVGVVLFLALPTARTSALPYAKSDWLEVLGHNAMTVASLARDVLFSSMLIGYRGSSIFDGLNLSAMGSISDAINAPCWTLHAELWGSLLVLLLSVAFRRLPRVVFWTAFVVLVAALGTSQFNLFVLGFSLYAGREVLLGANGRATKLGGATVFFLGLALGVSKANPQLTAVFQAVGSLGVGSAASDFHWQSEAAAALMFVGVLLCAPLRAGFSGATAQWLGRLSFSVYLLHFPILLTLSCRIFTALAPRSYVLALVVTAAIGIAVTLAFAELFERQVDRLAVAWSHRLAGDVGAKREETRRTEAREASD